VMKRPQQLRPESVEAMFRGHYGSLVRSLTLVAGDRETAEDVVQEAFAQAYLHWSRISSYGDPVGWVRRVALNRLFNVRRGRFRRWRAMGRLSSLHPDVTDEATQVTNRVDVNAALEELSLRQRTAVALYYVEDLPVAEIAIVLGVSQGTVKSQLHRSREVLRQRMEVRHEQ